MPGRRPKGAGDCEDAGGRFVVVGLGNPGPDYVGHRHNVGVMVIEALAERVGGRFRSHKTRTEVDDGRIAGTPAVLAKPRSYMNESGGPVAALCAFYRVPVRRLVVIHDELDLDFGRIRVKRGGGDNGHNGLKSITRALGSDYCRVRVGIGRPPGRQDPADFVLRDFTAAQRRELPVLLERAADAVELIVTQSIEAAANAANS